MLDLPQETEIIKEETVTDKLTDIFATTSLSATDSDKDSTVSSNNVVDFTNAKDLKNEKEEFKPKFEQIEKSIQFSNYINNLNNQQLNNNLFNNQVTSFNKQINVQPTNTNKTEQTDFNFINLEQTKLNVNANVDNKQQTSNDIDNLFANSIIGSKQNVETTNGYYPGFNDIDLSKLNYKANVTNEVKVNANSLNFFD